MSDIFLRIDADKVQLAEHGVDALLKPGTFGFGIQWIDDFGGVFPNKGVDEIQSRLTVDADNFLDKLKMS